MSKTFEKEVEKDVQKFNEQTGLCISKKWLDQKRCENPNNLIDFFK
jgi:hypothetical protein